MEWIGEFFGELIVRLLGFFAGKMFDEKSRTKRVIFFLIFYAPIAAVLVLLGVLVYNRTDIVCIVISYLLYALAAFFFVFLGSNVWIGKTPKEPAVIGKMGDRIEKFYKGYINILKDKNSPIKLRVSLFVLITLPLYILAIVLMIMLPELLFCILILVIVETVCVCILAKRIFGRKK